MPTVPHYWDSFETYAVGDGADADVGLGISGDVRIQSDRSRTGDHSIALAGGGAATLGAAMSVAVPSSPHVVLNMHVFAGGFSTIQRAVVDFRTGTTLKARVSIDSGPTLTLRVLNTIVATASTAPPTGAQYWEVIYYSHATSGYFALYIDGIEFVRFDGDTVGAAGDVDNVVIRSGHPTTSFTLVSQWNFDDVVAAVVTGGEIGDPAADVRLGSVVHSVVVPTGDVTSQGTPSAGSDNFAMVNDLPQDGDTTHVEFAATGDKDLYSHGSTLPVDTAPIGVKVTSIQRLPSGGTTQVRHLVDNVSTEAQGSDEGVGGDYAAQSHRWAQSPFTSGAWTKAEVEALRFGVEARS